MEDRPWKIVIGGGFALWIVVAGINLAFAATGLYTHFFLGMGVILAVEIAGLALILRATARAGFTYLRQLGAGAVAVLILAVLLFPATLFQWTYIAPDYADVIAETQRPSLEAAGFEDKQIEESLDTLRSLYTPMRQATLTVPGTLMTCMPMVIVLAFFFRARKE